MPTLNKTPWHPLPLTTPIRGAPPLLLQSTFTSSTYTIHLTDLVHIWSVTATKPSILALAETFQSPIDPSETSQLTILLTKLESALSAASAHTDITLTSTSAGDLQIHTSTELPRPLKELKWVFTLTRLPDAEFTNLFLLPVLSVVSTLADQVESLVRVVRDKDGIIERLTDQVAEQGLDVKNLLGGGRARRRGLERFEVEAWRDEYIKEGEKRVGEVVKEVFGEGVRCGEAPGVRGLGMVEGWWKAIEEEEGKPKIEKRESSERVERVDDGIRSLTRVISPRRTASPKRASYGGMAPSKRFRLKDSDDEDDDFEVQKTPPPKPYHPFTLKKPSPPPKSVAPEPDDTASDSDTLDLPSRRTFVKKPNLNSPPISRNRADDPARYTPATSGAAAADDTEDSDTVIVPSVSKPKRNMMIGGKRKPVVVLDDTEDDEVEPVKEVKKVVGRIGRIGKPKAESDRGGPPTISKPPPPPPPPPPVVRAPPEENEDERADRKRRELEKELEAKKKAPAKKKRKF